VAGEFDGSLIEGFVEVSLTIRSPQIYRQNPQFYGEKKSYFNQP